MSSEALLSLEPVNQQFVDSLAAGGAPPIHTLSAADARAVLSSTQARPTGKPVAQVEDTTFSDRPHRLRAGAHRPPRRQSPVIDAGFDTVSYATFADESWLTRAAMEWFWKAYLPNVAARKQAIASPLHAPIDQLMGLPDALLIVAENDVLRDEGEVYARKLSEAGVRVTSTRYNGTIHDFVMLNALADTPAARGAIAQAASALRSALE